MRPYASLGNRSRIAEDALQRIPRKVWGCGCRRQGIATDWHPAEMSGLAFLKRRRWRFLPRIRSSSHTLPRRLVRARAETIRASNSSPQTGRVFRLPEAADRQRALPLSVVRCLPLSAAHKYTATHAGRRWTRLEGGNHGVNRRGRTLDRLWRIKRAHRQPCHRMLKRTWVVMVSKAVSKVSTGMM